MKFIVTTVSINRDTRELHAPPRTELIDTERCDLFKDAETALDVERMYEAVWNDPKSDVTGEGLIEKFALKVIGVRTILEDREAWVYEAANSRGLDQDELTLAVTRELTRRAAVQIADQVEKARNPPQNFAVW